MKVLITGGYGFIGSFVAERFYKEGCEVYILDNLASGDKRNVDFKHKSYILSAEDRNCEELFRSNRFDTVVHLAAQVSVSVSMENPRLDTQSNILGLANMLALSHKYGVQKFIFSSSAAVYGTKDDIPVQESAECNPISPYGINKWIGETYCSKWLDLYGLETLCFRFSNVYGPRQSSKGEGGVISIFMERAIEGKELVIHGDGNQTRDFIYVEDVAEAIFRSSHSGLTGVYNLSTRTEKSVNELAELLRKLHGKVRCNHKNGREGDIFRSSLDNRALMQKLDWAPKFSFEEGIARTYDWYRQEKPAVRQKETKRERQGSPAWAVRAARFLMPFGENALLFALMVWLSVSLQNYYSQLIDFMLLYIIVMGVLYGNRQSVVAVALSCSFYTYRMMENGREIVSLLYDPDYFFQCAVYLFIGLAVGYSIERKSRLVQSKEHELQALNEKHTFLNEVYNETRLVKEELQQQIMSNGDSFGKIYSVTKALESLEPEKIFTSTVSVVESVMKANTVSIYTVNKYQSYLRLVARSSGSHFDVPKSIKVEDYPYIGELLNGKQLFVNKSLQSDCPLLSAPVLTAAGEVAAVISIHSLNFEHFTLYYQNLFKIVIDLIASALSRSFYFVEATGNQRYLDGTPVLKTDVFSEIMDSKRTAKAKHGIEYVLLTPLEEKNSADLAERIAKSLRETDYIGLDGSGKLMVLLSNSSKDDAEFVLDRFLKSGIMLKIVEEELLYA